MLLESQSHWMGGQGLGYQGVVVYEEREGPGGVSGSHAAEIVAWEHSFGMKERWTALRIRAPAHFSFALLPINFLSCAFFIYFLLLCIAI